MNSPQRKEGDACGRTDVMNVRRNSVSDDVPIEIVNAAAPALSKRERLS